MCGLLSVSTTFDLSALPSLFPMWRTQFPLEIRSRWWLFAVTGDELVYCFQSLARRFQCGQHSVSQDLTFSGIILHYKITFKCNLCSGDFTYRYESSTEQYKARVATCIAECKERLYIDPDPTDAHAIRLHLLAFGFIFMLRLNNLELVMPSVHFYVHVRCQGNSRFGRDAEYGLVTHSSSQSTALHDKP